MLDVLRFLPTAEGRARLWTRFALADEVHQTSSDTREDRYPYLFDFVAGAFPHACRILSYGCSTGAELASLRRRFPEADIVGAEINPRSRRMATQRMAGDGRLTVVAPREIEGLFDVIFALAVFQREPSKIAEMQIFDLTPFYPFARFDAAVVTLVERLRPGGLLCVIHAHYRIEDSSVATQLEIVAEAPHSEALRLYGPDGRHLPRADAGTVFRKRGQGGGRDVG
jgi:hypothetical protein